MYSVCSQRLLNFKDTVLLLTEGPFGIVFSDDIQAWLGEIVTTPEDARMVVLLLDTLRDELKELTGRPTPIIIYVNACAFGDEDIPEISIEDILIAFEEGSGEEGVHPTFPVMIEDEGNSEHVSTWSLDDLRSESDGEESWEEEEDTSC